MIRPGARTARLGLGMALVLFSCAEPSTQVGPTPRQPAGDSTPVTTVPVVQMPIPITTPTTEVPARPGKTVLPDVTVDNVAGGTMNLATLVPSPQPILLWFWAPS